jgi:hypothetical protein
LTIDNEPGAGAAAGAALGAAAIGSSLNKSNRFPTLTPNDAMFAATKIAIE